MRGNRASDAQIEYLVSFRETHPLFCRQQITKLGKNGKRTFSQMWSNLTASLNYMGPAEKDVKDWKETWKFLRKKSKTNKATFLKELNTTGNKTPVCILSDIDERISCIFGKYGTGLSLHEAGFSNSVDSNKSITLEMFMEENRSFAQNNLSTKAQNSLWDLLKTKLDRIPNGEKRDISEWKKCWREMKLRTIKKVRNNETLKPRQIRIRDILGLTCSNFPKPEVKPGASKRLSDKKSSFNGLSIGDMAYLLDMPMNDARENSKNVLDLTEASDDERPKPSSTIPLEDIFNAESCSDNEDEPPKKIQRRSLPKNVSKLDETTAVLKETAKEQSNCADILMMIASTLKEINNNLIGIKEAISEVHKDNMSTFTFGQKQVLFQSTPMECTIPPTNNACSSDTDYILSAL